MEKHYVFKSLFEDNITQVSSIARLWRSLDHLQQFPATFTPLIQITGKKLLQKLNFKRMEF